MTAAATNLHTTIAKKAAHALKVRRITFDFPEEISTFWYDNDPLKTLLLSAMSGGFPEGERFFIDSVRHYQDQITDPELRAAIRAFIGQEAHHSKEHKGLNEFMESKGFPISKIDRMVGNAMQYYRKKLSPERQLAHTAAIEHFTALMAEHFIQEDELNKMDPRMAKIWAWHAIEESEHKAVAFDVFKATVDDEWIRLSQMMFCTVTFIFFTNLDLLMLLRHAGHLGDVKMWMKGINHFWGKPGIFRKMLPAYLDYYKRDFHPWQHDNRAKIEAIKKKYLGDDA